MGRRRPCRVHSCPGPPSLWHHVDNSLRLGDPGPVAGRKPARRQGGGGLEQQLRKPQVIQALALHSPCVLPCEGLVGVSHAEGTDTTGPPLSSCPGTSPQRKSLTCSGQDPLPSPVSTATGPDSLGKQNCFSFSQSSPEMRHLGLPFIQVFFKP